jgi:hypothetical protein
MLAFFVCGRFVSLQKNGASLLLALARMGCLQTCSTLIKMLLAGRPATLCKTAFGVQRLRRVK